MDSADDVEEREDQLREDINVQIVLDKEQFDEDASTTETDKENLATPVNVPVVLDKDEFDAGIVEIDADREEQEADPIVIQTVMAPPVQADMQGAADEMAAMWGETSQAAMVGQITSRGLIADQLLAAGVSPEEAAASGLIGPSVIAQMSAAMSPSVMAQGFADTYLSAMASPAMQDAMAQGMQEMVLGAGASPLLADAMQESILGAVPSEGLLMGGIMGASLTPELEGGLADTFLSAGFSPQLIAGLTGSTVELDTEMEETSASLSAWRKVLDTDMGSLSALTSGGGGGLLGTIVKLGVLGGAAPVAGAVGTAAAGAIAGSIIGGLGAVLGFGTAYEAYKSMSAAGSAKQTYTNAADAAKAQLALARSEYGPGSSYYSTYMANQAKGATSGTAAAFTASNRWTTAQESYTAHMKGAAAALEQSRRVYGPGGSHENQADWISAQLTYHRDQAEYAASLNAARATYGPGTAYYNTALADATAKNKTPVVPPEWASAQAAYNKAMLTAKEAEDKAQAKVSPGALAADTHLKTSMHDLAKGFDNLRTSMIPTMSDFLDSLAKAAPSLMPFVKASVSVAGGFINTLSSGMQSSGFKTFMGDMTADVTPIMQDFATWTENAGATFGKFLELFGGAPAQAVGSWFDRTSARLLAAFGHPAVKGHLEGGKMVGAEGATGFFRDVNVQAMDRTFDAMGKLFGTTAQAVGKLLIAAEPVAGMVAGLVLDFDHLVLALPKWFLTDFMKVAATFMLIKTVLPVLVGEMTALNVEFAALAAVIVLLTPIIVAMLKAIGHEHTAQKAELAENAKIAAGLYKEGKAGAPGMLELAQQLQRNAKVASGAQRSDLEEQAEYYAWAAHQMAAGKPIMNFGQYTATQPNTAQLGITRAGLLPAPAPGSVVVHVYVGGKEITDLVDTRIEHNNKKVATRVRSGKR
jgi:hypothetical protein